MISKSMFIILILSCILSDAASSNIWKSGEQRPALSEFNRKPCVPPCKIFHSWCKNNGKCREKPPDCAWYCECPENCEGVFCERVVTKTNNEELVEVKVELVKETKTEKSAFDTLQLHAALANIYKKNNEKGVETPELKEKVKKIKTDNTTLCLTENLKQLMGQIDQTTKSFTKPLRAETTTMVSAPSKPFTDTTSTADEYTAHTMFTDSGTINVTLNSTSANSVGLASLNMTISSFKTPAITPEASDTPASTKSTFAAKTSPTTATSIAIEMTTQSTGTSIEAKSENVHIDSTGQPSVLTVTGMPELSVRPTSRDSTEILTTLLENNNVDTSMFVTGPPALADPKATLQTTTFVGTSANVLSTFGDPDDGITVFTRARGTESTELTETISEPEPVYKNTLLATMVYSMTATKQDSQTTIKTPSTTEIVTENVMQASMPTEGNAITTPSSDRYSQILETKGNMTSAEFQMGIEGHNLSTSADSTNNSHPGQMIVLANEIYRSSTDTDQAYTLSVTELSNSAESITRSYEDIKNEHTLNKQADKTTNGALESGDKFTGSLKNIIDRLIVKSAKVDNINAARTENTDTILKTTSVNQSDNGNSKFAMENKANVVVTFTKNLTKTNVITVNESSTPLNSMQSNDSTTSVVKMENEILDGTTKSTNNSETKELVSYGNGTDREAQKEYLEMETTIQTTYSEKITEDQNSGLETNTVAPELLKNNIFMTTNFDDKIQTSTAIPGDTIPSSILPQSTSETDRLPLTKILTSTVSIIYDTASQNGSQNAVDNGTLTANSSAAKHFQSETKFDEIKANTSSYAHSNTTVTEEVREFTTEVAVSKSAITSVDKTHSEGKGDKVKTLGVSLGAENYDVKHFEQPASFIDLGLMEETLKEGLVDIVKSVNLIDGENIVNPSNKRKSDRIGNTREVISGKEQRNLS